MVAATPPIAALAADVFKQFPGTRNGGISVCKKKSGNPNEWSEHSWGNAIDIMIASNTQGDQVAAWVKANGSKYNVGNVLWEVPMHWDHVHVEGFPTHNGVPPCAGGANDGFSLAGAGAGLAGFGLAGALIGGLTAADNPLDVAKTGLTLLFSGETWLRVMWGVGGFLTLGAGVLMLAKEMGAPIPSVKQIAGTVTSVATKGVL